MVSAVNAPVEIAHQKRIVLKIGSALLVDAATGKLNRAWLMALALDVSEAKARGQSVVLVSSGSIALGRRVLGLPKGSLSLEQSQAAAAVGQIQLARAYEEVLAPYGITTAQVLVTLEDSRDRRRYLNSRATLETLLSLGVVPIVNENDTIATDEIRYGDNDRLAAQVAAMVGANALVLFSDVDGLYTANPMVDDAAQHLPFVSEITPEISQMAGEGVSGLSKGGMVTKLMAARIAMEAGCAMAIALGKVDRPLDSLIQGAKTTWFLPSEDPQAARKRWIAGMRTNGVVMIDAGAVQALQQGKSLLPAGVTYVGGHFGRGAPVAIEGPDGHEIGKGLARYTAEEARAIKGCQSTDIDTILGYAGRAALIHRDDMVI